MVSIDKLKALLSEPERFTFRELNYGETACVALKGEKKAWLCGVAQLGGIWDEDGKTIWPEDVPFPYVSEEQLAEHLNSS
jgi:hypothetical protein